MATSVKYPTANTATTGFNGSAINPTDAYTDNTVYATLVPSKPRNDEDAHSWRGFDFSAIPDGSTINSVTVKVQEYVSASWAEGQWRVALFADVTSAGALAPGVTTAIGAVQYTRATTDTAEFEWDLGTLSTEPTLAQLKGANFGVRIEAAQGNNGTSHTWYIDTIEITVDYTVNGINYDETGRSVSAVATITVTDDYTHTGVDYDETGRSVSATATIVVTDVWSGDPTTVPGLNQVAYRVRSDVTVALNAGTGWAAAENTAADINMEEPFRIRFAIEESTSISGSTAFKFQYRHDDGGGFDAWADLVFYNADATSLPDRNVRAVELVHTSGSSYNPSTYGDTAYAHDAATTKVLAYTGAGSFTAGYGIEGANDTPSKDYDGNYSEHEILCIIHRFWSATDAGTDINEVGVGDDFEFRMVELGGTVLAGYGKTPSVNVTRASGLIGGTAAESPHRSIVADANGNLYTLIETMEKQALGVMMKSTDDGVTWEAVDVANGPTEKDFEGVDMVVDNTTDIIHIIQQNSTVLYYQFYTSAHASADTWNQTVGAEEADAAVDPFEQCAVLIHRPSTGDLVAFYTDGATTASRIYYCVRASDAATTQTWGTPTLVDQNSLQQNGVVAVLGENEDIHIFIAEDQGDGSIDILYKAIDTSQTITGPATEAIVTNLDDGVSYRIPLGAPVKYMDGTTEVVMLPYSNTTPSLKPGPPATIAVHRTSPGSQTYGTAQTQQDISTLLVYADGNNSRLAQMALGHQPDTQNVYALWVESDDTGGDTDYGPLYRTLNEDEAGWGSDTSEKTKDVNRAGLTMVQVVVYNDGSDDILGYVIDNAWSRAGGTGGLEYGSFTLPSAGPKPSYVLIPWTKVAASTNPSVSTPDHADLDHSGDMDVRVRFRNPAGYERDFNDVSNRSIVADVYGGDGSGGATADERYAIAWEADDGRAYFTWRDSGGTEIIQTSPTTGWFPNPGDIFDLRITMDVDNGGEYALTSYSRVNSTESLKSDTGWTSRGTRDGATGPTSWQASDTAAWLTNAWTGHLGPRHFMAAVCYAGLDNTGTIMYDPDFQDGTQTSDGGATFTDTTGKVWTVNGTAEWKQPTDTPDPFEHISDSWKQVSAATSIAIPKPWNLQVDDLMVVIVTKAGTADWTSEPSNAWTEENTVGAGGQRFSLGWRIATAADVAASDFTWGWASSGDAAGVISVFDVSGETVTFEGGTSNSLRTDDTTPASGSGSPSAGHLLLGSSSTVDGVAVNNGPEMVTTGLELAGQPNTGTATGDIAALLAWKIAAGTESVFEVGNIGASGDSYVHYWWFSVTAGGTDYDETGRSVSVVATVSATDQADFNDAATVSGVATIAATDSRGQTESTSVAVTATVTATDSLGHTESVAVSAAATVTATDSQGHTDSVSVDVVATVTATDTVAITEPTSVSAAATVSATDRADFNETTSVAAVGTITAADAQNATESLSVSVVATVSTTDRVDYNESVSVSIVATVNQNDVYTPGGGNYDETGRLVSVTATVTATDQLDANDDVSVTATATVTATDSRGHTEATSVAATATVTATDSFTTAEAVSVSAVGTVTATDVFSGHEATSVSATGTVTATDRVDLNEATSVSVVATVDVTDDQQTGGTDYDETGRVVTAAATVTVTDQFDANEATSVSTVATVAITDSFGTADDVAVSIAATVTATDLLTFHEDTSVSAVGTVIVTGVFDANEAVSVSVLADATATDVAAYHEAVMVSGVATVTAVDDFWLVMPTTTGRGLTDDGQAPGRTDDGTGLGVTDDGAPSRTTNGLQSLGRTT